MLDPRVMAAIAQLRGEMGQALNGLAEAVRATDAKASSAVTFDRAAAFRGQNPGGFDVRDIPCQRRPFWIVLNLPLVKGSTASTSGVTESPTDGAFVIERIVPIWQPSDADNADYPLLAAGGAATAANYVGRQLPVSAHPVLAASGGLSVDTHLSDLVNASVGLPEFDLSFQVSGDSRYWNQGAIPGAALFGLSDAYQLMQPGWINNRDSLTVYVSPTRAVPYDGTLRIVLSGFKLMGVDSVDGELNRLAERAKLNQAK